MKVMVIIYHDINTEERTKEIVNMACYLGDTFFVSYKKNTIEGNYKTLLTGGGRRSYFSFISDAIRYIYVYKPQVIILHDNYTAIILALLKITKSKAFIIFDSSELYIVKYGGTSLKLRAANIMKLLEKKYLKYANLVICASKERAEIMLHYYQLKKMPMCFDNMHKLVEQFDEIECEKKYGRYIDKSVFKVLYGGGISNSRRTLELVKAVGNFGEKFMLIVVGFATNEEVDKFNKLVHDNNFKNIFYLGFLPRSEWQYLMNHSDVSVSVFAMDTPNNINCASGKVYESLFAYKPVLVSENPPLKRLCNEYGIGVSDDNFYDGLKELQRNYAGYVENVKKFVAHINYSDRAKLLSEEIKDSNEWKEWLDKQSAWGKRK